MEGGGGGNEGSPSLLVAASLWRSESKLSTESSNGMLGQIVSVVVVFREASCFEERQNDGAFKIEECYSIAFKN